MLKFSTLLSVLGPLAAAASGCDRAEPADVAATVATEPAGAPRLRVATVVIRFDNGRPDFGSAPTDDRLRTVAVFADVDPADRAVVDALAGQPPVMDSAIAVDTCARQAHALPPAAASPMVRPASWIQLLDVGNLELRAGNLMLPLQIHLLPSVIDATRGVRYDAAVEHGRSFLAAGALIVNSTGGDGVAPFSARVQVPRPVRITFVGEQPTSAGVVQGLSADSELRVRWGSVDGTADLELVAGAEQEGQAAWLRCRLRDDGDFSVPAALVAELPARSPKRPWTVMLVRRTRGAVAGFSDQALVLELADSVHVD
ncbi:MAG: hypothetical protein EXR77_19265 [Myxococcales bacterium]|nr:hypothetical protein [Myxococcales bacterium]